jgi:UDP-hydrolysing UDP-N-acetyl-D-glucosamine 2-epimerase
VNTPRAIAVVTGSRAEYGLLYWLIRELQASDEVRLQVVVTGMHLSAAFGHTVDQIRADGVPIAAEVEMLACEDTDHAVARSTGVGVIGMADAFQRLAPDIVVVLGDRFEILAAAEAAMLMRIPVAHIHGGEVTEGAIDESIRHAVSKMASLHFVSAAPYGQRLIRMGEDPSRVHVVGTPGLDHFTRSARATRDELTSAVGLDAARPFVLATYHPATRGTIAVAAGVEAMLEALDRFPEYQVLATNANADAGGRAINARLADYAAARPGRVAVAASLGTRLYLTALREAAVVVGNSSSGIIEAPAVGTPTVNIGPRQQGRLRAASIVDCGEDAGAIARAITAALDPQFRARVAADEPPYGRPGNSAAAMAAILRRVDVASLRVKRFFDGG